MPRHHFHTMLSTSKIPHIFWLDTHWQVSLEVGSNYGCDVKKSPEFRTNDAWNAEAIPTSRHPTKLSRYADVPLLNLPLRFASQGSEALHLL